MGITTATAASADEEEEEEEEGAKMTVKTPTIILAHIHSLRSARILGKRKVQSGPDCLGRQVEEKVL